MTVLIVAHARDQVFHKLHLVGLGPLVEQLDADVLLLLVVALRRPLSGSCHWPVADLDGGRASAFAICAEMPESFCKIGTISPLSPLMRFETVTRRTKSYH